MVKKIISLSLIFTVTTACSGSAVEVFTDKEFGEKCTPYIGTCINMSKSKKEKNSWEIKYDGKKSYYVNIYSGVKFPKACMYDDHMLKIIERSRYSHNGLNFELDRKKENMGPVSGTGFTYEIFGSKDRYQEVGQRLLKSVADAKKRLKDRKEEIDLEDKLSREQSDPSFLDFFVPYNKKAAVAVALGTGAGAFLVYSGVEVTEEKKDEKKLNVRVPLLMSIFYIGSTFFANLFTKPYAEPPKPYLSDTKYKEYYQDLWLKREAVCDFYAALTGESKHCSFLDDSLSKEKTLSGLPLNKAIEEFGFVLDLPGKLDEVWYKDYGDVSKNIHFNPGNADVYAQNERYQRLVRDFGEEFVRTGDMSKLKLRTKDQKQKRPTS